jgi:hypothetical protein
VLASEFIQEGSLRRHEPIKTKNKTDKNKNKTDKTESIKRSNDAIQHSVRCLIFCLCTVARPAPQIVPHCVDPKTTTTQKDAQSQRSESVFRCVLSLPWLSWMGAGPEPV